MARAKNMNRADARRRTRDQVRAETTDEQASDELDAVAASDESAAPRARATLFKLPDFKGDAAALPHMFRTRNLLWLPFILLLVGFVLALTLPGIPTDVQPVAILFIQYFFLPQALFTYFIGGFIATRGSYLVGFILGIFNAILWTIVIFVGISAASVLQSAEGTATGDAASLALYSGVMSIVLGTFAAGFAGWYRDFLRQMQERGKTRRADQELKAREQRRTERQETRRASRQRPTS